MPTFFRDYLTYNVLGKINNYKPNTYIDGETNTFHLYNQYIYTIYYSE